MGQKYRISTDLGVDQLLTVELKQEYDLLEILSLKFSQTNAYTSFCSDYGVVVGRVTANNGFGIPNAKVSIFIPLSDTDATDPVISALYPFTQIDDLDQNNYRYNLLPSRQQHGGHAPTGTFPDQSDILNRDEILEVFEKYYKFTVKTNMSGDFMIWGVPTGQQTLHIDVDTSDIGCFSLRPDDFIRQGAGLDKFKNTYTFKSSSDLNSLPQIITFNKTIQVYPFWGNTDFCQIGISRTDFDISSAGIKIEPKAMLIGGIYTDTGKNSINKNCEPRTKMGRKCDLTTKAGKIEAIRFSSAFNENHHPILEEFDLHEDIAEDGGFSFPVPMNMDYLYTNEFGEMEYTNNPNKGVPTSACYRFRFTLKDSGLDRVRAVGSYLLPNIREYNNAGTIDMSSYYFGADYSGYPSNAQSLILNGENGFFYPQDYFYRFTYGKVYTVSSFQSSYFPNSTFSKDKFLGIKELVPSEEEDCSGTHNTPPVNFGIKNYTFTLLIADVLLFLEHLFNLVLLTIFNTLAILFHELGDFFDGICFLGVCPFHGLAKFLHKIGYSIQNAGQKQLSIITYPECIDCNQDSPYGQAIPSAGVVDYCQVGSFVINGGITTTPATYTATTVSYTADNTGDCVHSHRITDNADFVNRQSNYSIAVNGYDYQLNNGGVYLSLDGSNNLIVNDVNSIFSSGTTYNVLILDNNTTVSGYIAPTIPIQAGCELYNVTYDRGLTTLYYDGPSRIPTNTYNPGDDVVASKVSDLSKYELVNKYYDASYSAITPSGYSELSAGVFNIIPGAFSNTHLWAVLKEYRIRKRVGKMFCGGIVNYSFVDNWLHGSLYFFLFKAKGNKYCRNVVVKSNTDKMFYYRSAFFENGSFNSGQKFIGRPTTFVDLGPRDLFIGEICTDPSLNPECSVSRAIGATSYQDFGEILGLTINYRLETTSDGYDIPQFFNNTGFANHGASEPLNGDILQLISENCEAGIQGFDLQNPLYVGYTYQYLQPILYPQVFSENGDGTNWGPTPITLKFDYSGSSRGEQIRECLNTPGNLGESTQPVPFYLWNKRGYGFGSYSDPTGQSWDYGNVQVQPLQGMTYGYQFNGSPNEFQDPYLLLPITYNFDGLVIPNTNILGNVVEFDVVEDGPTDNHAAYNERYPGFTYLYVTSGYSQNPDAGILYTRYGPAGTDGVTGWNRIDWNYYEGCIIPKTQDYYGEKQILSTPFQYYFGLRHGKTGLDKLIEKFGPISGFTTVN